jgi:hypothetical protein
MFNKTILALAFGLAIATGGASTARADLDITINLGFGGDYGRDISCGQGRRIVERRFNHVVARDCKGSRYDYTGRRNGKWYFISVSSSTGRISDVRRWFR